MISHDELTKHNTAKSCWLLIHGNVYDLTEFLDEHPGGSKILLKNSGQDATSAFSEIHSKDVLKHLEEAQNLGEIAPANLPIIADEKKPEKEVIARPPLSMVLNTFDMEAIARNVLSREAWAYYSSGAEDEITLRENHSAFHRIMFKPRIMRNVRDIDCSTRMFGAQVKLPIYVSATALGKLGNKEGEVVFTRACGTRGIIQMMPTLASCSLSEMLAAAIPGQVQWFQLYVNQNRKVVAEMLKQAESNGIKVLFITVDAPALGKREKDMRVKFDVNDAPDAHQDLGSQGRQDQGAARAISTFIDPSLSWDDLPWFKQNTKMKLVLKGIQCGEDAVLAIQHGCSGIVVSNHGGRQLDSCRSGIEILEEVVNDLEKAGLRDQCEVYVDGGFRRGADIIKALCLGANGIGLGRPMLYGMSAYGQQGVEKVIDILQEEMEMTMRLLGAKNLEELGRHLVITTGLKLHVGEAIQDNLSRSVYEPLGLIPSKL